MKGGRGEPRPPPPPSRSSCGQSIAATVVERSGAPHALRSGGEARRSRVALQQRDELTTLARERLSLGRGQRLSAFHRKRHTRVSLHATDQHLEVEMRRRGQSGHPHESDGLTDIHARTPASHLRKRSKVPVASDETVRMAHFDRVPVSTLAAGEDHDAVADGAYGCALRGG